MSIEQLDTENADRDITSLITVLTDTPSTTKNTICQVVVFFGDGSKDLDGTGGDFEFTITVGGYTVQPDPQTITFSTAIKSLGFSTAFPVPANMEVIARVKSPNAADSDVDMTAYLFEVSAQQAIVDNKLDHLVAVADSDDVVNDSIIGKLASTDGDWSNFVEGTDALQSIRDALVDANPQNHSATANNETTGTLDSGTYSDTSSINTTYYQTSPVGALVGGFGLNVDLTFNIGTGRVPDQVSVTGYFDSGAKRTVQVWVYDYNISAYVQVSNSTNDFGNAGSNQTFQYSVTNNMVQASDGEMKVRFTSTSINTADDFYCDYVNVTSIAQSAGGLTADAIQTAVWARSSLTANHDETTLGYVLSNIYLVEGKVVSVTSASQFILDGDSTANDAYNGMVIVVEDESAGFYEARRVVDYIGATKEVFLDRALSFTPEADDHFYLMGTGYADVNSTHVAGTAQTANDNGADINTILADLTDGGRLDLIFDSILEDTGTTLPTAIAALNNISVANILAGVVEGTLDVKSVLKIALSVLAGESSGAKSSERKFLGQDGVTERVVATLDADGNRTEVVVDGS